MITSPRDRSSTAVMLVRWKAEDAEASLIQYCNSILRAVREMSSRANKMKLRR